MKTKNIYLLLFLTLILASCEKDFLEIPPQDQLVDETFWSSEANVETFSWGFYPAYFTGYGSGYAWGKYFSGETLNDDFSPTNPSPFTKQVPTSGGGWTFAWVRKANIFIDRVQYVPMEEEAIEHWTGIGRFFRGLEYSDLVNRFGDVQWFDQEISEDNEELLYKKRDDRTYVMDKVLEDFQYAADHVRINSKNDGLMVNRNVVLGYMSRVFLFEGTWQKYHGNNAENAKRYLDAAKWAANEVIASGAYSLADYREVFNSLSLANNPEVLLYREYESGKLTHALNSYNNKEPQTGVSKDAIDAYLAEDGLPISLSPIYQGDHGIQNLMANRDPRIKETFVSDELRLDGVVSNYSTTGIATHKFLNESIANDPIGSSSLNPTDAPIIRYGEVLMNYAEAALELSTVGGPAFSQDDLDKSVNALRDRPGIGLPHLQVLGGEPGVNGAIYDDPDRDPTVSPMIWEIRRARRVELMMEGFRYDDLRRWKKLDYLDMVDHPNTNRGAWVDKSDYASDLNNLELTDGTTGYIIPAYVGDAQRRFEDPRVYLRPIPLDQIKLYADHGVTLEQNPGW